VREKEGMGGLMLGPDEGGMALGLLPSDVGEVAI